MLPNIGWGELIVILGIVLLVFGPKRLPDLAQSLGKSIKLFKNSMRDANEDAPAPKPTELK